MRNSAFLKEFKDFAMKGNALDMAVGVIIGGAFGKIVTSIVNDIIMPPIGWLIGGINFSDLKYDLPVNPLRADEATVSIAYGNFLQTCFNFLIISFCVFMMMRMMMKITRKQEEKKAVEQAKEPTPAPPAPSNEEKLLAEIRDLLKNKQA